MVNLVAAQKPLLHGLMKMAGVRPYIVEIEPGTVMNFWVPCETIKKPKKGQKNVQEVNKPTKPVVVLVHGFAAEGIVTWQFQVGALTKKYSVYVPDLLFFGGSITNKTDRSPAFQAHNVAKGLAKLGVDKCALVGFSYGGMVVFKIAELYPNLVERIVVSGSIIAMTDSISDETISRLGFSSSSELLLPDSVKGLKALLSVAAHKKLWFPDRLHKDYLEVSPSSYKAVDASRRIVVQVMFSNRKERSELLEALVISNKDNSIPKFPQKIHLLWGEKDQIFNLELAHKMKEQIGENATFQGIKKAGHLVHLERPCVYNRCLKQFLASQHTGGSQK
ncbi:monoacylglycerol lipase ABHD6-like isoform X1 [Mangifera indica]|uniref:monoacylglycerol lipase ABHD6-like isoform X1 n=1 Tax=Mangifera indica TaxID=29780 RepID=UPI001CFB4A24|nr:monoacylglycerol lipase ABHD6-like isoform X1 [Mangifera indica]